MDDLISHQQGGVSVSTNEVEGDKIVDVLNEVVKLRALTEEQQKRIELLQKKAKKNMDDSLRPQKRYTSENCVVILSPFFDVKRVSDATEVFC